MEWKTGDDGKSILEEIIFNCQKQQDSKNYYHIGMGKDSLIGFVIKLYFLIVSIPINKYW